MQTDIYESTKVNDISDRTGQLVTNMQILDIQDITAQQRAFKLITVITQRLADGILNIL